jgi:hypothetical protein
MRTALDAPTETLDAGERSFVAEIREQGWFRTSVLADTNGPGFSYTTGFWLSAGQPEPIMFSVKHEITHSVFWDLFRSAKASQSFPIGTHRRCVRQSASIYFPGRETHYADHLGWSRWFYGGNDFPCLQIVWPDRSAVFPWDDGFDREFIDDQSDLTENGWLASLD